VILKINAIKILMQKNITQTIGANSEHITKSNISRR